MFLSTRYYFIDSLTGRSIVDSSTGRVVDHESMASMPGETATDRATRMLLQSQRCAALNREDHEPRQQSAATDSPAP